MTIRDITDRIPLPLSSRRTPAGSTAATSTRWDVMLNGRGYLLAVGDDTPYMRQTAPIQKQQIDTSTEPGEQTLDGAWTRSQTSWHCGAGAPWYEPSVKDPLSLPSRFRFSDSAGVDPWTEGSLSLLHRTVLTGPAASSSVWAAGAYAAGAHYTFRVVLGDVSRIDEDGTVHAVAVPDESVQGRVAVAGSVALVGDGFGLNAGPVTGATWVRLYNKAIGPTAVPWWVKGRVVVSIGPALHELALNGATNGGVIDAATVLYTHPDPSWTWTAVVEAPSAILAAGYSGGVGTVYRFSLEDSTASQVPKLSQPYQVADFPPGEEVHSCLTYLGKYIALGTSAGIRIGVISDAGEIQYGPVLYHSGKPVRALAARASYVYAAVEEPTAGVVRVDLSRPLDDGLTFPYAADVTSGLSGVPTSVCFVGNTDRVAVAVTGRGVYIQSATEYVESGTITSGAIRYGTGELKAFQSVDVRADTTRGGSVGLSVSDPASVPVPVVTLADGADGSAISLASLSAPREALSYTLVLRPSPDGTVSPVVSSVGVKAFPSVRRRRMIRVPLRIADFVTDRNRNRSGGDGAGWEALSELEALEGGAAVVTFFDYRTGSSDRVQIEEVTFRGTTPPSGPGVAGGNFGGVAEVTLRTI